MSLIWCYLVRYEVCIVLWGYWAADRYVVGYLSDGPQKVRVLGLQTTLPLCCHFWTSPMGTRGREENSTHHYINYCVTEGIGGIFGVTQDSSTRKRTIMGPVSLLTFHG